MEFIYDAPWWLWALPIAAGLTLAVAGLRRGDGKLRNVGLAILLVGAAVFGVSRAVETDPERAVRRSRELVAAVERMDWTALPSYLDPQAQLTLIGLGTWYESRDQIVTAAKSKVESIGLSSLGVPRVDVRREGQLITTELDVYVTTANGLAAGRPIPTTWRFVWTRPPAGAGDQWVVRDLEAIKIGTTAARDAQGEFPRPR